MTRRLFYFLLSIGLRAITERCDLDVSAQELKEPPVWLDFIEQGKQEHPTYLSSIVPERIPSDKHKQTGRLPQLNQQSLHWALCSGGLLTCLIVIPLLCKKRKAIQRVVV